MYYRRKILLSLLESFEGRLGKTRIQKLLFIMSRWQNKKAYDFVPYKFGCFSFQADQDLRTMVKRGMIVKKGNSWVKIATEEYLPSLKKEDEVLLSRLKRNHSNKTTNELIRYTYENYPYFAINSGIVSQRMPNEVISKIEKQKRQISQVQLFTIGYEGKSLEKYLNQLIINDIRLLCDVRKNPFSMKFGFSKSQLKNTCESLGIKYLHIPELGIDSEKRKALNSLDCYNALFEEYERTVLRQNHSCLTYIQELINSRYRVALTCFEAAESMCHRGRVAKALTKLPQWNIPVKHL